MAPEVLYARQLVADSFVGDVLSTTLTAFAGNWGATLDVTSSRYLLDKTNGATMLSIPMGHTLAAVRDVVGEVAELSSALANRRTEVRVLDSGATVPKTADDQVLVSALLASGAPFALHYRGGAPRGGPGLVWDINGSRGDLRITGAVGHSQLTQLTVEGAKAEEPALQKLEVPASFFEGVGDLGAVAGNVARLYGRMAADLRDGTRTAPSFDDAVALHRVLDTIEASAASGQRLSPTVRPTA